jgi:hypothetical protein
MGITSIADRVESNYANNPIIESSKEIIAQYFLEKLQKIKADYMTMVQAIWTSEIWRYWWLEFTEAESSFLVKYLNIATWMIFVPITNQDWNNIGTQIATNLRTSKAWDEVSSILPSINIKELAQDFFSSHECAFSAESFSFPAKELLDLVRDKVFEWLDNLFHDSIDHYLLFMKSAAVKIEDELKRSITQREVANYTILENSLIWEMTRHKMIDVSIGDEIPDKISMEFFNVPIAYLWESGWSPQQIQFIDLNDEKPYNDLPQWFFPFTKRNNGASIMAFFFGESPYQVLDGMTHWANLVTNSGSFKDAIITSEDIKTRFLAFMDSLMVDENIWLRMTIQWKSIAGLWIPEMITFEVMTPQEVKEEKIKRDEEVRKNSKW